MSLIGRQPGVAGPAAMVLASPFLLLSVFVHHLGDSWLEIGDSWLAGLDYAVTLTGAYLLPMLLESLAAALVVQAVYLFFPALRPVRAPCRVPPYARTLNLRLLFLFVPLILVMTIVLVSAMTARTLDVATLGVVDEVDRNATGAAEQIAYFTHIGQGLLDGFAGDAALLQDNPDELETHLRDNLGMLAFFNQLALFDSTGELLAYYPEAGNASGRLELTEQEQTLLQRVLEDGAPQSSTVHRSPNGEAILSILMPVENEAGQRVGVLIGHTWLSANHPVLGPILESLQWIGAHGEEQGEGFIVERVDERWQIIAHPDPAMLLTDWYKDTQPPRTYAVDQGEAYEGRNPKDNTRQLVYYLPVQGHDDWAVVIRLPYKAVQAQAAKIAGPLLGLQFLAVGCLLFIIPFVTGRLMHPLQELAAAAECIAEGDLTQPVQIAGGDEVSRVADAFENMRVGLRDRLYDLERAQDRIAETEAIVTRTAIAVDFVHRLNNLAGTIPVWLDQIREHLRDEMLNDEALVGYLDRIEVDVDRLLRAAEELKSPPKEEKIDVLSVLSSLVRQVLVQAPANIEVRMKSTTELPQVQMVYADLANALWNIMENGVDAMRDGGVLRIEADSITDDSDAQWVCVQISDQGEGIADEDVDKVFSPFSSTKVGHMGYGLWRSKNIVERAGGDIDFVSHEGLGTTFTIRLPGSDEIDEMEAVDNEQEQ